MRKERPNPKVVMFGPDLNSTSGISNVINNWIEAGIREKVNLDYISTLKHNNIPGRKISKTMEGLYAYGRFFLKSLKPIDLVHIHFSSGMSFYRKLAVFLYAKLNGMKTIVHSHGSNFDEFYETGPAIQKRFIKLFCDQADAIFVLSRSWRDFFQKISSNKNIHIIYNGALVKMFGEKIHHGDRLNISFMGQLGKRKGVYDLLEAFERLSYEVAQVHLVLGGDGDIGSVREIVRRKKLQNRVDVLGWVGGSKKLEVFRSTDIYALPSYSEGLPGSILEAMAAGVPIISTPVGGISEAVLENRNGFLILPGDIDSLYHKLRLLCQDKELRVKMGRESRSILEEKFDIEKIVEKVVEIYNKMLKRF